MRNKNLWIILAVLVLIAAVFAAALLMKPSPATITGGQIEADTATDLATTVPAAEVQAYLLVTVGGVTYQPLPLQGEGEFSLTQGDGSMVNTIHVTPTSVWMAKSTCDNQDCVDQGVVDLHTMDNRVLGNMIICLPHQVSLELYTAAEMEAIIASLEEAAP